MDTSRFLGIFQSIIALSIILLFAGCGGGGGDDSGTTALSLTIDSPSGNITINKGESVTFQVTASRGTAPYTFQWDFGGGATNSTVEDPGSITFNNAGSYTVTITVTDNSGTTRSTSVTINVQENTTPQALSATINSPASNVTITQGGSVNFQATVTGGTPPYTYLWNFSGGATNSTVEDPGSVTFNTVGTYNVTFTVIDNEGGQQTDSIQVNVVSQLSSMIYVLTKIEEDWENDGSIDRTNQFSYNLIENSIIETTSDRDGYEKYLYNNAGDLIRQEYCSDMGDILSTRTYTYNSSHLCIYVDFYYYDINYQDNGDHILIDSTAGSYLYYPSENRMYCGDSVSTNYHQYYYDTNGNEIKYELWGNGQVHWEHENIYDSNNNIIETTNISHNFSFPDDERKFYYTWELSDMSGMHINLSDLLMHSTNRNDPSLVWQLVRRTD